MDFQKELIAEFDRETAKTRKVLDAIPADADFNYKPHPKSMSLGRLAGHTAEMAGEWATSTLTLDKLEFTADHQYTPFVATSKEDLLEHFDKDVARVKQELAGLAAEKWDGNWKLIGNGQTWVSDTRYVVWRDMIVNHMIHHRAQLGVYLRLLDKPIPGTYGPSADGM
jgi:uncharacterized damage-inducible protein DinB